MYNKELISIEHLEPFALPLERSFKVLLVGDLSMGRAISYI